jgi:hypothetical protein
MKMGLFKLVGSCVCLMNEKVMLVGELILVPVLVRLTFERVPGLQLTVKPYVKFS